MLYYVATTALLAVLLFFPTSRLIYTLSVRRLEKKLARTLFDYEYKGQRARARFIAVFVVTAFAALFNYSLIGIPRYG